MTYEEIIKAPKAVLRFTATWCGPCQTLAPVFDEVSREHPLMKVYVIDVDKHRDLAQKFGVQGIPMILRIESGSVKKQVSGSRPKPEIEEFFK